MSKLSKQQEAFYVYAYRIDGQMAYIGKGKGRRLHVHLRNAKNPILRQRISAGKFIQVRIIKSGLSEPAAFALERRCISKWADTLCNISNGQRTVVEACFFECDEMLSALASEEQIIKEGDWRGLSVDYRLKMRKFIEDELYSLMDVYRKEMALV
jgi:hypothetical protein